MDVDTLKKEMAEAWLQGGTFERPLLPVLQPELQTLQIPAYVYGEIKEQVTLAARGERTKVFRNPGNTPPAFVRDMPLKEQLKWIWRYRALLRKQRRLSFWKKYSGISERIIREHAAERGYVFAKEVVDETVRRRRYNKHRVSLGASLTYEDREVVYTWEEILGELRDWRENDRLRPFGFLVSAGNGRRTVFAMARTLVHAECMLLDKYGRSILILERERESRLDAALKDGAVLQPGVIIHAVEKARRAAAVQDADRGPDRYAQSENETAGHRSGPETAGDIAVAESTCNRRGGDLEEKKNEEDLYTDIEIM